MACIIDMSISCSRRDLPLTTMVRELRILKPCKVGKSLLLRNAKRLVTSSGVQDEGEVWGRGVGWEVRVVRKGVWGAA